LNLCKIKVIWVSRLLLVSLLIIGFVPFLLHPYGYCDTPIVFVSDLDRWAQSFLEQVAGVNLTGHNVTVDNMGSHRGGLHMNSAQYHCTDIEIKVQDNNQTLHFDFQFIDSSTGSKLVWYIFEDRYSVVSSEKKSLNDSLLRARQAIEAYRAMFNVAYCDELPSMISTAIQNQSLTVEDPNALLNVSYGYGGEIVLDWYKKIAGQYTVRTQSIGMTISKDGLLTSFRDNLAEYRIATTATNVSEQEALNASVPIVQAYANQHGQQVVSTIAMLSWMADSDCKHGNDVYAVYPVWDVRAKFDKTNEGGVDSYSVIVWADNGQIAYNVPQGSRTTPKGSDDPFQGLFVLAALGAVVGLACLGIYLRHKARRRER
jgi:hypothetical protein